MSLCLLAFIVGSWRAGYAKRRLASASSAAAVPRKAGLLATIT
jgi:hypothetical protein